MIGIDIIKISRVKKLSQAAKRKLLTESEMKLSLESQAGAIAAKEALAKALNKVPPRWLEIEIMHDKSGKPYFSNSKAHLSISHDGGFAVAVVMIK